MPSAVFDIGGRVLAFEVGDDAFLAPFRRLLDGLERPGSAARDVVCTINHGAPRPGGDLPLLYEGPLPYCKVAVVYRGTGARSALYVPDALSLEIARDEGRCAVVVAPGFEHLLKTEIGLLIVETALAITGQTLVHAAALACPDRQSAILLFAPSGAGKTTTALALAREGFGLMTDDTAVVRTRGGGYDLWGLPRLLKVHRNTAALMPWLKPSLTDVWNAEDEQPIAASALPGIEAPPPGTAYALQAVVRLCARVADASLMRASQKSDLLAALCADNLRHSRAGTPDDQMRRFETLAGVVRNLPAFDLHVGEDISDLGAAVQAALRGRAS